MGIAGEINYYSLYDNSGKFVDSSKDRNYIEKLADEKGISKNYVDLGDDYA